MAPDHYRNPNIFALLNAEIIHAKPHGTNQNGHLCQQIEEFLTSLNSFKQRISVELEPTLIKCMENIAEKNFSSKNWDKLHCVMKFDI